MLGNIYSNRTQLLRIIMDFYLSYPILNFVVLFMLLVVTIGFIPALFTSVLYVILTVCIAFMYSLWEEKNMQE